MNYGMNQKPLLVYLVQIKGRPENQFLIMLRNELWNEFRDELENQLNNELKNK